MRQKIFTAVERYMETRTNLFAKVSILKWLSSFLYTRDVYVTNVCDKVEEQVTL
jgi:hypothetical protein